MSFEKFLKECPAVAILRGITPCEVPVVCDILAENGIRLLEIPLNSPDALNSIAIAVRHAGDRQMVGAGTVLTPEEARGVAAAGGRFAISPNTDPAVIRETKKLGMLSIPGFLTPSEAFVALAAGADYLKLFPAGQFGTGYIRDIRAVIKEPIMAVGGVNAGNIPEFMKVCCGVGIGSALYKPGKTPAQIAAGAAAIVRAVKS